MGLSELTIRLLLLFFPGIVCHAIVDALTVHKDRKTHEVFLRAFVLGILSYATYAVLLLPLGIKLGANGIQMPYPEVAFFRFLSVNGDQATVHSPHISFPEIFWVAAVAVILGVLLSVIHEKHWFHNLARKLGITKKFGENDVWMFAFNAPEISWATVRDMSCNLMYQGYIRAYSDADDTREILLSQVNVYKETTGESLYEADHIYLSRDRNNLTVEMHNPPEEQECPTTTSTTNNASQNGELFPSPKDRAKVGRIRRTRVPLVRQHLKAATGRRRQKNKKRNNSVISKTGDPTNGRSAKE